MTGYSRDFAFNRANVAYNTGKPNRAEFQLIRIERTQGDSTTDTKNDRHPCCLVEEHVHSARALDLDNVPVENLALVVGEYLPENPPKFNRLQLPTNTEVFNHRVHQHLTTRDKTALVVCMMSHGRCILCRLLDFKNENELWTAGPLSANIHEHIYFYREFTDGVKDAQNHTDGSNDESDTDSSDDENNTNGSQDEDYIDGSDNESDADGIPISTVEPGSLLIRAADGARTIRSAANRSAHLVESGISNQKPEDRDQIVHDASPNTNLTSPRPEVSDEMSRLFDYLMNGPSCLAHGDTARLLSYCKENWGLDTEELTLILLSVGLRQGALAEVTIVVDAALYGPFTATFCDIHDDPNSGGFNNLHGNIKRAFRLDSICNRTLRT
ncbi:hypothetical protein EDB82DRAFT_552182 [Fusarium venenatum]|uniref:uncharacterized protein n=1 Tax=Fusarium venenatum TaxID=56646 RepID=UPI001D68C0D8|nr:hypothetical protein EDB82DRAFT_552182 [Fusarium venenatum]